jgi:hypothetical protein
VGETQHSLAAKAGYVQSRGLRPAVGLNKTLDVSEHDIVFTKLLGNLNTAVRSNTSTT